MSDNTTRLRDAGLVKGADLPEPYKSIVSSLTPEEVETIVKVKGRIDSATDVSGHTTETADPDDVFNCF
jgi:hypothetical protein